MKQPATSIAATRALKPALMAGGLVAVALALPLLGAASAIGFIPQTLVFAIFGQGSAPSHAHMLALGAAMFATSATLGLLLLRRTGAGK